MILLTGGTGFVGSVVMQKLAQYYPETKVIALRHRNTENLKENGQFRVLAGSLQELSLHKAELRGVKTLIHLASKNIDTDGTGFDAVNVEGMRRLMVLSESIGVKRAIYLSSTGVYGHASFLDADETTPTHPDTPLSRSKCKAEQIIQSYAGRGMETLVLRHRFVIGEADRHVLPRFIKAAQKLPFWLKKGRACLSFIDVEDLAQIILRFAFLSEWLWSKNGQVFHVTNGENVSLRCLIETISEAYAINKQRFNMPYLPLYALVRAREILLGIDPESKNAGNLSSIRLKLISQDNHFSNAKLMALFPDLGFKKIEETIRQFVSANPLSTCPNLQ